LRISELSRVTGVPVATVKFYLREGLLPAGELTSPNQASYGDGHVRRLRLIRALVEIGGVSIAGVKDVLAALDDESLGVHELLGAVQYALRPAQPREDPQWRSALADVNAFLAGTGWRLKSEAPSRMRLADVLHALRCRDGEPVTADAAFGPYVEVAAQIAAVEIASLAPPGSPREALAEEVAVGVASSDAAFSALRLLAQEDASARRYG
jgi:DNA-binding transcriptional MerR regulator